ncbi:superoxide dismutase [Mesoterricola sediminis]|uniref:superoxide dismutase n=1 Tax=Mesoterricola sediminis TaxID=2927980 RepID=A0AA48GPX5_9BACT|nr:Fe-Mn family superoxide dismutase [Mesoterricola sediminis]BDU75417.1 superoxide dismutase [Mesoterricola sediminis]
MDRRHLLGTLAAGTLGLGLAGHLEAGEAAPAPAPTPQPGYTPRPFAFEAGLPGLSKDLLAEHLALYKGYVGRTSALVKDVLAAETEGKATPMVQELRRRLGFEFSGMRLHELYFEALRDKAGAPGADHPLQKAIRATWGSFDAWWAAFKATCVMPGIGWGALVKDPATGRLMNAWIQDHENQVAVGTVPLLVVDVWEHAYVKDYGATARAKYVDAVRPLIDWGVVEKRY